MKKRELFRISPEAGNLVRKYGENLGADISLYADPSGKRGRLRKAAENLLTRICRVADEYHRIYQGHEAPRLHHQRGLDYCTNKRN